MGSCRSREEFVISFGLNHMAVRGLDVGAFCALASSLGCAGVEIRQDTSHEKFTDGLAKKIAEFASKNGLNVIAVSEIGAFDDFDDQKFEEAKSLISFAKQVGAKAVSFIPRNDDFKAGADERKQNLRLILTKLQPVLNDAGIQGLIEPLGFESASIRFKSDVVNVIEELGFEDDFKIIHDTFHHALAGEHQVFASHTGLVHISGVEDQNIEFANMQDDDRVLVGPKDRLGNIEQLLELRAAGYKGPVSFEPFSPMVQNASDPKAELERSMKFIEEQLVLCAA